MRRILVVKLADLGDLLTATPALRALRLTWPDAAVTALVTPHAATLLENNDAVDQVVAFPKALFDDPRALVHPIRGPRSLAAALGLGSRLRAGSYDTIVLLHHLVTKWGALKYQALAGAVGAPVVGGLDNGRGGFLTHRAADAGFGERHEVDYCLDVAAAIGATNYSPRLELHLREDELAEGDRIWSALGLDQGPVVVLHPGSGRFSLARRWAPERFAAVGDALAADGLGIAIVAGPGEEDVARGVWDAMQAPSALIENLPLRQLAAVLRRARSVRRQRQRCDAPCRRRPNPGCRRVWPHQPPWGPYPPSEHEVVRLDLPCSPCLYRGLALGDREGCPPRMCLNDLPPELVVDAAHRLLSRSETTGTTDNHR